MPNSKSQKYPVTVIKNASVSCSEVNSQSTSPSRKKEDSAIAVCIIEVLDLLIGRMRINKTFKNLASSISVVIKKTTKISHAYV